MVLLSLLRLVCPLLVDLQQRGFFLVYCPKTSVYWGPSGAVLQELSCTGVFPGDTEVFPGDDEWLSEAWYGNAARALTKEE